MMNKKIAILGTRGIPSLLTTVEDMDITYRADMSAKARHLVMSRYDWDIITNMYQKILMES
ncbi:MAG: hypothetical protein HY752_00245 [Nitrospirae bacterium]|nr:hypothetical protein [Nitrospirota bacterium]